MSTAVTPTRVLIISPRDDIHALAVSERLATLYGEEVQCRIFDPATYPILSNLSAKIDRSESYAALAVAPPLARTLGTQSASLLARNEPMRSDPWPLRPGTKVWWRRYRPSILHPDVVEPEFQQFCSGALQSVLVGALSLCEMHNPIDAERAADRKLYQLFLAQAVGLDVPRTLISTEWSEAKAFVDDIERRGRRVVYKHASAIAAFGMPTRIVDGPARARFDALKYAPALFQEEISGGPDLRIAVIGRRAFCCEWRGSSPQRRFADIRLEKDLRMFPTTVPQEIRDRLFELQQKLGLTIGVYDFKLDEKLRPFFFEVNPSGQWLDMEIDGRQPVSEAVARLLVEGPGASSECVLAPFARDDLQNIADARIGEEPNLEWSQVWRADDRIT